jgi:hypothetical protein
MKTTTLFSVMLLMCFSFAIKAQLTTLSYVSENAIITQNFDILNGLANPSALTTTAVSGQPAGPWDLSASSVYNKTELTGWQVYKTNGTATSVSIISATGGNATVNFNQLGITGTNAVTDRSIGGVFGSTLNGAVGVVLVNNTGTTLKSFSLSYKGEQWKNTASAQTLAFKYAIGNSSTITDISQGTFTAATALNFVTPNTTNSGTIDGNLPANSATITGTISGITWANGECLVLRWDGTSGQLAIDDVSFSATSSLSVLSYTTDGSTLTQNFDILSSLGSKTLYTNSTGSAITTALGPWDLSESTVYNKTELTGWQLYKTGGSLADAGTVQVGYGAGGNGTVNFYYLGNANTAGADQSLGGNFGTFLSGGLGVVLQNNTGTNLTSFTLSYTGEQWKKTAVAQTLAFKYAIGSATTIKDISNGSYNSVTELNFVTPNTDNTTTPDGNAAGFRTAKTYTVLGISWPNGERLALRWDCSSGELSIDDVSFSATVDVPTGNSSINDYTKQVLVYKNASKQITVTIPSEIIGKASISIFNITGLKLENKQLTSASTVLNKSFSAGVYLVNIIVDGKTTTSKLVID